MIARLLFLVLVLFPALVVLIPIQFLIMRFGGYWNAPPRWFHRLACVFLGLRVKTIGAPVADQAALLLANHISWTDIVALGAVADVSFVSKAGIRDVFFVGFMASMQRTLYVDYHRKQDTKRSSTEMAHRLRGKGAVLLFAEGHRDLGTHVLPFRSALVGAAQAAMADGGVTQVAIQPTTIAYTHVQGLPVARAERSGISGRDARGLRDIVDNLLASGVKDITIVFGSPILMGPGADRKEVTRRAEIAVRRQLVALNRRTEIEAGPPVENTGPTTGAPPSASTEPAGLG